MSVPVRRTQAQRRAETEQRVLEAAIELVAEQGVGALTLAAVGTRAGYSRGIVTHHYGSRQKLMEALARSLQGLVPPAPTDLSGAAQIIAQVDRYLTTLQERPRDTRVFSMLWAEAVAGDPDLRPVFAERDAEFRAAVARAVRAAVADGSMRAVDPDAIALWIVGQLRGIGLELVLAPGAADLATVREQVGAVLRAGLT